MIFSRKQVFLSLHPIQCIWSNFIHFHCLNCCDRNESNGFKWRIIFFQAIDLILLPYFQTTDGFQVMDQNARDSNFCRIKVLTAVYFACFVFDACDKRIIFFSSLDFVAKYKSAHWNANSVNSLSMSLIRAIFIDIYQWVCIDAPHKYQYIYWIWVKRMTEAK